MKRISWTTDMIRQEAVKFKYRIDFQRGSKGAYLAALKNGIVDDVCIHMSPKVKKWSIEEIQAEAIKFHSRAAFLKLSPTTHASGPLDLSRVAVSI